MCSGRFGSGQDGGGRVGDAHAVSSCIGISGRPRLWKIPVAIAQDRLEVRTISLLRRQEHAHTE